MYSYLMYIWWYIWWWWWCQFRRFNTMRRFTAHQISTGCNHTKWISNRKRLELIYNLIDERMYIVQFVHVIKSIYLCSVLSKMNSMRWPLRLLFSPVLCYLYSLQLRTVYKNLVTNLLLMEWTQAIVVSPAISLFNFSSNMRSTLLCMIFKCIYF